MTDFFLIIKAIFFPNFVKVVSIQIRTEQDDSSSSRRITTKGGQLLLHHSVEKETESPATLQYIARKYIMHVLQHEEAE